MGFLSSSFSGGGTGDNSGRRLPPMQGSGPANPLPVPGGQAGSSQGAVGSAGQAQGGQPTTVVIGGQTYNLPPGMPPGALAAIQQYAAFYGPQMTGYQNQANQQGLTAQQASQDYNTQAGALNSTYQNQLAHLGLQQQGVGIQQGDVTRQEGYYNQLYGLDQSDEARNVAYQNQLAGYNNQQFGVAGGLHTNQLDQLGVQAHGYWNQAQQAQYGTNAQNTASGSFTSVGHQQQLGNIKSTLTDQLASNKLSGQQADLNYKDASIAHDASQAGFKNTIAGLESGLQRSGLNHAEQEAQLQSRGQQLSLQAQGYGLDAQQYGTALTQGLAQLNLGQTLTIGQLMDAANSSNAQAQAVAMQIIQQAMAAGLYQ